MATAMRDASRPITTPQPVATVTNNHEKPNPNHPVAMDTKKGVAMDTKKGVAMDTEKPDRPVAMDAEKRDTLCAALERQYVHEVYNRTAHYFTDVRYKAWPRVQQFVLDLPVGALVADVGCGSGKYLNINKHVVTVGCDYSVNLLQGPAKHGRPVLACDNLRLPFKDARFDAVVSIGVIHHLTTPSRRAKAIQELERVLRPGGRVMIYVWAMEQRHRKFKAQDVLVPWHLKPKQSKQAKNKKSEQAAAQSKEAAEAENVSKVCPYLSSGNIDTTRLATRSNRPRTLPVRSITTLPRPPKLQKQSESKDSSDFKDIFKKHFSFGKKGSSPVISAVVATVDKPAPPTIERQAPEAGTSKNSSENNTDIAAVKSQKKEDFPGSIKNKLFRLIGIEDTEVKKLTTVDKDRKYRELIDKIVKEDSKLFCNQSNDNVIPSVFAFEGFAVREFPGSSCSQASTKLSDIPAIVNDRNGQGTAACINNGYDAEKSSIRNRCFSDSELVRDKLSRGDKKKRTDNKLYKQKCVDWLEHGKPYYTGNSDPDTLDLLTSVRQRLQSDPDTMRGEEKEQNGKHSESQVCKSGSGSNDDVFGSSNDEGWAKVTAQVIETMQTQVENVPEAALRKPQKSRQFSDGNSNGNTVVDGSLCRCKTKSTSSPMGEYGKDESGKLRRRSRNRSESSVSSFSSVSSDTDSNESEVEEMTLCALCRGDSVEYSGLPQDTAQTDVENGHSFPQKTVSGNSGEVATARRSGMKPALVAIESQSNKLRSSHDSGYSDVGLNIPQVNTQDTASKSPVRSAEPNANTSTASESSDAHKRFYHVFKEGELDALIQRRVSNLTVVESFYDHANWCVIAQKN